MQEYMLIMALGKPVKTLKEWRAERGLTLEGLGEIVGLSKGSMGDYEKGRREPGMTMAYKLAHALGIELTQVADWIPEGYGSQEKVKAPQKAAQEEVRFTKD